MQKPPPEVRVWYYLDENNRPQPTADHVVIARMWDDPRRKVAITELHGCSVSTVFLCLDHQFRPGGPPLLYETMVFLSDGSGEECVRASTREEALENHRRMVEDIKRRGGS